MRLPTSTTFTSPDFPLASGVVLAELEIAYETYGTLAADGNNAILLNHGYTSSAHAGGTDGWFSKLLGPGKAIDTDRYFVICSNMLGSCFGTSGPASINPATGQPYGPDFPAYTPVDMVAAQHRLIDDLGINQLKAVIGYSYGGHLAFLWGCMHPERMRALVPFAGLLHRLPTAANIETLRQRFATSPGWNDGHYYGQEKESGVWDMLVTLRIESLQQRGHGKYLEDTISDPQERKKILTERAESWADQFDANSLIELLQAGLGSDATPDIANIKAPVLHVLGSTDHVAPPSWGPTTRDLLKSHGVDATYFEIPSVYGHAAPVIDADLWAAELEVFLERTS